MRIVDMQNEILITILCGIAVIVITSIPRAYFNLNTFFGKKFPRSILCKLPYDEFKLLIQHIHRLTKQEIEYFISKLEIIGLTNAEFITCIDTNEPDRFLIYFPKLKNKSLIFCNTSKSFNFKGRYQCSKYRKWQKIISIIAMSIFFMICSIFAFKEQSDINNIETLYYFFIGVLLIFWGYNRLFFVIEAENLMRLQSKSRTEQKNIPEKVDDIPNLVETHSKWVVSINILGKKLLTIQKEH